MVGPEISRRCKACGAAVRANVSFCPQCGEKMQRTITSASSATPYGESPPKTSSVAEEKPQQSPAAPQRSKLSVFKRGDSLPVEETFSDEDLAAQNSRSAKNDKVDLAARDGEERSTPSPRAVIVEKYPRPRSAHVRAKSTVVIDEASDNPGFRFVVISVLFFILFLLLLVLSNLLG